MLISNKADLRTRNITRNKQGHYIVMKKVNSPISFNNSNFYISVIIARVQKAKEDRIK